MRATLLSLIFCLLFTLPANAGPAAPNETIVKGRVVEYGVISSGLLGIKPETPLYKLVVSLEKAEGTRGPNFLKDKEGKTVALYSKERLSSGLFGKRLKITVTYRGDERGGLFWIIKTIP